MAFREIIQHEDFDIWCINDITIDNDDNVFFAGMTEYGEACIGKLDRNHKIQWIKLIDGEEYIARIESISVDSSGMSILLVLVAKLFTSET